jgi:hypothetical protein
MVKRFSQNQALFLIVVLNLVLCLPGLWAPFYNRDELTNALYARFINLGELGLRDFLGNAYLLSHFLYVLVYRFVAPDNFWVMHVVHALWRSGTCLAMYWAGKQLDDEKVGRWAALFYCVFSFCFLSKDFHSPGAESLSLLPAALSAGFFFKAVRSRWKRDYFFAGAFSAVTYFCKAPMGLTLAALCFVTLIHGRRRFLNVLMIGLGFLVVFVVPLLMVWPPQVALHLFWANITRVNETYIQTFHSLSSLYLVAKFFIRLFLILGASLGMTVFAFFSLRAVFDFRMQYPQYWQKVFFLFLWFILLCFAVSLGGRMFYHYYLFLFAPLPLLAASGIKQFELLVADRIRNKSPRVRLPFLSFVRRHMVHFMWVPALAFFIEGALNYSSRPEKLDQLIHYIQDNTRETDRIYVWGYMPQIYFFSKRLPSTVYFWAEFLAGSSPGTPAMEYVRATGQTLDVTTLIEKDFSPHALEITEPKNYSLQNLPSRIGDHELMTVKEILQKITHPYWQKVFADFLQKPPRLFIDTSPLNRYAFGHYPIQNYELLKRFVSDNYKLVGVIDGTNVYRLKTDL